LVVENLKTSIKYQNEWTYEMTHITELSIKNYRVLRELKYVPKQINILAGKNNTGKTALLDAIALNIPEYSNTELESYSNIAGPISFITYDEKCAKITSNLNSITIYSDILTLKKECSDILPEIYDKIFLNMGELYNKKEFKNIFAKDNFKTEFLRLYTEYFDFLTFHSDFGYAIYPYTKNPTYSWKRYNEFSKIFGNSFKKLIYKYASKNTIKGSQLKFPTFYLSNFPGIIYLMEKQFEDITNIKKIGHYDKLDFDDVSEEEIIELEEFIKKNNVVGSLKRLSQNEVTYQKEDSLVTIPIFDHGDGFIALLNSIRFLLEAKNGILLIEEPENHLHPRYIEIFIRNLFLYCQKLNVQVFMSTHSLDLIRYAVNYPETKKEKNLLLISKMTSDGEIVEKFDFNADEGQKAINELYIDLRGS
jgi:AAA15 family ATPase/GTPase